MHTKYIDSFIVCLFILAPVVVFAHPGHEENTGLANAWHYEHIIAYIVFAFLGAIVLYAVQEAIAYMREKQSQAREESKKDNE